MNNTDLKTFQISLFPKGLSPVSPPKPKPPVTPPAEAAESPGAGGEVAAKPGKKPPFKVRGKR